MDSEDITAEQWILTPEEQNIVMGKNRAQRLPFALLLLFYRVHRRFPVEMREIDPTIVVQVARQLRVPITPRDSAVRTVERHRAEIRALAGFREATVGDAEMLTAWLSKQASVAGSGPERIGELLETHCRKLFIEPPSRDRVDRIVRDAINEHEEHFCAEVSARLSPVARARLEALLYPERESEDATPDIQDTAPALLLRLRSDPGRPCVATLEEQLARLKFIRDIQLPADLFAAALPQDLEVYRRRVAVEAPYELRRHSEPIRLTMLAAFVYLRARTLTDDLTETLIETIHRIHARAERKVDRQMLEDIKRVRGKQNMLFDLAGAVLDQPDGIVRDVVFPVVGEQTLHDLVKEGKATSEYRTTLRTVTRNSYKGHYRRMVPEILHVLEFRSNNEHHRPVIEALELVKRYADATGLRTFPPDEHVPIDGIVSGLWREAVMEPAASGRAPRINRITYEICVLQALREKLRCKEIWIVGAHRYRNPDEDLPADFDAQRAPYYEALKLPLDADRYIADLQAEMRAAFHTLDRGMPKNRYVSFSSKAGGWITLTGLDPQPEPPNLSALKAELASTWPMTSLLDMVKETDLRLRFTDVLKSRQLSKRSIARKYRRAFFSVCTALEQTPAFCAWRGDSPASLTRTWPISENATSVPKACGRQSASSR
jgi:hypothetical protein